MPLDIPFRFEDSPLLWTVDEVLTARECEALVADIEAASPTLATNNPIYRDQDRVIRDDEPLAARLFDRLRPHLPERMGGLTLSGLNPRLRLYRYRPGQRFSPHMDHWYQADAHHITLHTVLVYLNQAFDGGETRFFEQLDATVRPRTGSAAVFQHKLRHEGCEVRAGRKYALRTDVVYRSDVPLGRVGVQREPIS